MSSVEIEDEDTSDITSTSSCSSSSDSSDDEVKAEKPPPQKKRKRSRDSNSSLKIDKLAKPRARDPYELLHRQMTSEASSLKKLQEQCELCISL